MSERGGTSTPNPPGAVEPLHFGRGSLFGCLQGESRSGAVVICQPFGHEYITLHRALRQLATQIARRGAAVLRFDHSGCGDSPGRLADARLETWCDEIDQAVSFLEERTGAKRIGFVGVRLGAALALRAARQRSDVAALALWDPVIWGRAYLRELARSDRRMRKVAHVVSDPSGGHDAVDEVLGFPLADPLKEGIRGIELDREPAPEVERILLLESRSATAAPLGACLRAADLSVESECEPHPDLWSWQEDITRVELPHRSVRRLASWMAEAVG